jgi:hypothetical protein
MVLARSAMNLVMAWRVHHVAYVENLWPRPCSNLSTIRLRPMLPARIRPVKELDAWGRALLGHGNSKAQVGTDATFAESRTVCHGLCRTSGRLRTFPA